MRIFRYHKFPEVKRCMFYILVLLLFQTDSLFAQKKELLEQKEEPFKPRLFNIYAELGGHGGIYSVNFRQKLRFIKSQDLYWSGGFCVLPQGSGWKMNFPVSINWYHPYKSKSGFIFGTGQVLILSSDKGGYIRGTFRIAYRRHFLKWHCSMELAYTPFYSYIYNFQYENWFGAGFAYHFMRDKK